MKRVHALLLAATIPTVSYAQISPDSPVVKALLNGRASAALPESQGAQRVATAIQQKSGSQGEVTVEFVRISRFVSQPNCGRIGFTLYQKSTNTAWGQFGGQLNICEDGGPPLRVCKESPALVPADSQCSDGLFPAETQEVQAAITRAIAGGSVTGDQFQASFRPKDKTSGKAK